MKKFRKTVAAIMAAGVATVVWLASPADAPTDCRSGSVDPAKELCVGDLSGASGGCQGDSGGPQLVPGRGGAWTLSGVTSRDGGISVDCNLGIFTSVPAYLSWIKATVGRGV